MRWKSVLPLVLVCGACSGAGEQSDAAAQDTLTRAQRDSVIGASSLPGAGVVQRAVDTRDTVNARGAAMDSILRD